MDYPLVIDLSPEVKDFARQYDQEIRTRMLEDIEKFLFDEPFETFPPKYDQGSAEHGKMTQLKLMTEQWTTQRRSEWRDEYWYTAILMFRERFFNRSEPEED